jgi:membrane protease YdiL (CAAX protease family)
MFIEQALKGKNDWWRVFVTTLFSIGLFVINIVVFLLSSKEDIENANSILKGFSNNFSLFINLIPFVFLLIMVFVLVRLLHERSIVTLTTARKKIDFKRVLFSFLLIVTLSLVSFGISYYFDSSNIEVNFKPLNFGILLLLSLLLFPFQIGLEEYVFRGYLMQQIGIVVKNRWLPLLITSILFGIFHSANPEVAELGYGVMIFYIGTGLLLGIMTLMDDSIELALGFHFGNNLMAAILVTTDFSALQTDAFFKYTTKQNSPELLTEMIVSIAITYPILLFIMAKKYKWNNWKERLTGNVKPLEKIE